MHADPVAALVAKLGVILLAAKLGGELATRLKQPAVLGEVVVGIVLANLPFGGAAVFRTIGFDETIAAIAGIGALILLFEVGLEVTLTQLRQVGWDPLFVAVLGVVAPFGLGWILGAWLLPEASGYAHAFLGATLCATSVGITARVLQDLQASHSPEARIIVGAAVIDDVLGLLVLAGITAAISAAAEHGPYPLGTIAKTAGYAGAFLVGALVVGTTLAPRVFAAASLLQVRGVLVTISLSLCFLLAWVSSLIGLAPIVGAFAAGLVLEHVHFTDFVNRGERPLDELLRPIADLFVPLFFVVMGLRTDLGVFAVPGVIGLAVALIVVAIIGKQACSLGVTNKGINRLAVGIGMIPRGEVGLIFANAGAGLVLDGVPIVPPAVFSAVVIMVVVTTLVTPPALKWGLARGPRS